MENNDTGVAESVFIGGMFVLYGSQYADILEHYGRLAGMSDAEIASEAASVRAEIGQVSKAVKTAGWDGEWFVRAYDAYSRKVGTHEDTEGQIYIEPQGMCVMAGIGLDDGKAQQALKSVKERLTCDWGTAILAPAYSTYRIELGEISSYRADTRKTAASSATTTRGSPSPTPSPAMTTRHSPSTSATARRMSRTSPTCARWNRTSTARWWPVPRQRPRARARTPG